MPIPSDRTSSTAVAVVTSTAAATIGVWMLLRRMKAARTKRLSSDADDPNECIYLDYNGTTPVYPDVLQSMMPYLREHFGNPSSSHAYGKAPRMAIDKARNQLLQLLGVGAGLPTTVPSSSVWFTACGTESDNLAIQLALEATEHTFQGQETRRPHIVTSNVEHPAVSEYLKKLERQGRISITYVPVQGDGRILVKDAISAIEEHADNTILVTIMLANNESGAIQPIREISQHCRRRGILMHTDAAQAAGKISIALADIGDPDMVSIVGHKMGAPKGVAALYVRDGCMEEENRRQLPSRSGVMLVGGGQEFGRRAGTENTPYIVGLGAAAEYACKCLRDNQVHCEKLRGRLLEKLSIHLGKETVHAHGPKSPKDRLPNTLSVGLRNVHSGELLGSIGHKVAASAGATCHSTTSVSSVLQAMRIPNDLARGTLRLSVGPKTTMVDVDRAALIIAKAANKHL